MKARDWLTDALVDLNVVAAGETPPAEQLQIAFRRANQWIDSLALERLTIYHLLRTQRTLSAGVATLTIGTGGDINIVRPTEVEAAGLVIDVAASPQTEIPISVFSDQEWENIRQKALTSSLVQGIYYDHNWSGGLGQISLWPAPNVGNTALVIYTPQALTKFADLTTDYTFPPGYELFLQTNVLEPLAGAFGASVTAEQQASATKAARNVKRGNIRPEESTVDAGLLWNQSGLFDWRTGRTGRR